MGQKHIDGPWHVSGSKVPIVYDASGWAVCNATVFHGRHDEGQSMANARLIAAAPELLAALEQCLPIIDAHRRTALGEGDIAAMNARAAIAKATGAS